MTRWGTKFDLLLLSQSVRPHVHLSEQIHPWNTVACCWDVKEATNEHILKLWWASSLFLRAMWFHISDGSVPGSAVFRPAYLSLFDCTSIEISRQYRRTPRISQDMDSCHKVRKSQREWMWVRCHWSQSLRVARVNVRWHLHISSHFWSWSIWPVLIGQKVVFKPMNIGFALKALQKLLVSHLQLWGVWIWSYRWQVTAQNWRRGGRMHKTKETISDQTTTVQESMRWRQGKQHTWCIVFGESVLRSLVQNNFSRCKKNRGIQMS